METMLRVSLTRFNVGSQPLSRILHVTSTIYRKVQARAGPSIGQIQPNAVALIIFEVLAQGLRKEGRITPATITSIIEASSPIFRS